MSWSYRLVRVQEEVGLYEVYYDAVSKEPVHRTVSPIPIFFNCDDDRYLILEHITDAFNKEVLDDEIFEGKVVF